MSTVKGDGKRGVRNTDSDILYLTVHTPTPAIKKTRPFVNAVAAHAAHGQETEPNLNANAYRYSDPFRASKPEIFPLQPGSHLIARVTCHLVKIFLKYLAVVKQPSQLTGISTFTHRKHVKPDTTLERKGQYWLTLF